MDEREIIWTPRALSNKLDIYDYWYERNQSFAYPQKLELLFNTALKQKAKEPESGRPFNLKRKIRYYSIRNYRLYYSYSPDHLVVLSIWDSRRNPTQFKL